MYYKRIVLGSTAKWIIARVARRTGKTTTAVEWARSKIGKRVLYVVPHEAQIKLTSEFIRNKYEDEILGYVTDHIVFKDRTDFFIVSAENLRMAVCGRRCDAIVVDEAGYINWSDEIATLALERLDTQVLMVSTELRSSSIMAGIISRRPSSAIYVTYDYKDALKDQVMTPQTIFDLQATMSKLTFAKEFGPYDINVTNEDLEFVLKPVTEY
jgi:hypothetical protein